MLQQQPNVCVSAPSLAQSTRVAPCDCARVATFLSAAAATGLGGGSSNEAGGPSAHRGTKTNVCMQASASRTYTHADGQTEGKKEGKERRSTPRQEIKLIFESNVRKLQRKEPRGPILESKNVFCGEGEARK
jgi:hypothetical protein